MILDSTIVAEFWDNRPCNIRHSQKPVGSKEYFDEVEKKKFFVEPHILPFASHKSWKNKKVLEIGCGIGTDAINFARYGAEYTGIELSKNSLEVTKKRFEVYGYSGNFYHGDAEKLTEFLPQQKFDLVYSWGVIHHACNPEAIVKNIKNYMSNESQLRIMLYAQNSWKNFMIEAGYDQPEAQSGCPIAKVYSVDAVRKLLGEYKIIEIAQDHIFPYQIEPYKNNNYVKQPWFESMDDAMFRVLEKNLGWHMLVRAIVA